MPKKLEPLFLNLLKLIGFIENMKTQTLLLCQL